MGIFLQSIHFMRITGGIKRKTGPFGSHFGCHLEYWKKNIGHQIDGADFTNWLLIKQFTQMNLNNVYRVCGDAVNLNAYYSSQSGVHVVVIHGSTGIVMARRQFLTYQPAEHKRLASMLQKIQAGRIVVLAGVPEWLMFLGAEGDGALQSTGCNWAARAVQSEVWACVANTGSRGGALGESIATNLPQGIWRTPRKINLQVAVPKSRTEWTQRCPWYALPGLRQQAEFCETYEGYEDLCSCHAPFFSESRKMQDIILMSEEIPVAVVTANKPYNLYRCLKQLYGLPGISQTNVLVIVDGTDRETLELAAVMQATVAVHSPEGQRYQRTNGNIRFALHTVFTRYPLADKAIILEDDLLLSKDLLKYFHHLAPLLSEDPTVFCINAYSSNSFRTTAGDPGVLLRARSYPMYGWMVNRRYAQDIIKLWVRDQEKADWDFWLSWENNRQGRDVVYPEVSRTFHAGSAGVHVSGFEQALYFNRMIYNQDPNARLMPIKQLYRSNYNKALIEDLKNASVLQPTDPVCKLTRNKKSMTLDWIPSDSAKSSVIYVQAHNDNDKLFSFKTMLMCFMTYDENNRDMWRGVMTLRWQGSRVYIIGCPMSPYCSWRLSSSLSY
ncbi:unnamed protein product, partial [Meganyctiphanes norvegica]